MAKLITFGDSWTAGDCTDLITENIIPEDDQVTLFNNGVTKVYKNPWPVLLGEKLKRRTKNLAIPGNCNKAITTQIYDYHVFEGFKQDDIVIVILSTWHREYAWHEISSMNNNKLFFKNSSARYISVFHEIRGKNLDSLVVRRAAYNAFFDFFTIKNFFESRNIRYYIGWAFTNVSDFSIYLNPSYVEEIVSSKTLVDPFLKYYKFVTVGKLLHPKLEDHVNYAAYLYSVIEKDHAV